MIIITIIIIIIVEKKMTDLREIIKLIIEIIMLQEKYYIINIRTLFNYSMSNFYFL